jgi:hypothetical protein
MHYVAEDSRGSFFSFPFEYSSAAFPNIHFEDTGLFGYLGSQLQVAFLPASCEQKFVT